MSTPTRLSVHSSPSKPCSVGLCSSAAAQRLQLHSVEPRAGGPARASPAGRRCPLSEHGLPCIGRLPRAPPRQLPPAPASCQPAGGRPARSRLRTAFSSNRFLTMSHSRCPQRLGTTRKSREDCHGLRLKSRMRVYRHQSLEMAAQWRDLEVMEEEVETTRRHAPRERPVRAHRRGCPGVRAMSGCRRATTGCSSRRCSGATARAAPGATCPSAWALSQGAHALHALEPHGRVAAPVRAPGLRGRQRVRDDRCDHRASAPAQRGAKKGGLRRGGRDVHERP